MSENLKAIIIDAQTGTVNERDFSEQEIAENNLQKQFYEAQILEQQAKAAARESALAKLADLGLTAEEIAAL
jgi:hypothetical protein